MPPVRGWEEALLLSSNIVQISTSSSLGSALPGVNKDDGCVGEDVEAAVLHATDARASRTRWSSASKVPSIWLGCAGSRLISANQQLA